MDNKHDPPPPYPGMPSAPISPGIEQQYYTFQSVNPMGTPSRVHLYAATPTTAFVHPNDINNMRMYGTNSTTAIVPPDVVIIGACPACRIGILKDEYTCMGVMCAILFFPLGILCCLADKTRRCSNCGASFD